MSTAMNAELSDGTSVRFLLGPAPGATAPDPQAAGTPTADAPADTRRRVRDLPEGMGRAVPVAAGGGAVAGLAAGALRGVLKPLGPLVQGVHDAVTAVPDPPDELSVTFGVQVGQDLKLGIVGGNGQAHLTVTATWKPTPGGA
ncbi:MULTISPECIES: CU044_2847 family protein [unclassified Streptomyces]|uniref:CU044_2847 family protein n=1 Tax=unclassified Streptomyces TaxID=2593676 RepID=UPI0038228F1C